MCSIHGMLCHDAPLCRGFFLRYAQEAAARRSKKREKNRKKNKQVATTEHAAAEQEAEEEAQPSTSPPATVSPAQAAKPVSPSPARSEGRVVTVVTVRRKAPEAKDGADEGPWREASKPHKDSKKPAVVSVVKKAVKVEAIPLKTPPRAKALPLPVKSNANGHDVGKLSAAFKQQANLHTASPSQSHKAPVGTVGASPGVGRPSASPKSPATAKTWKQPRAVASPASTSQQWPPLPLASGATNGPADSPASNREHAAVAMAGMAVPADDLWSLPLLADATATPPAIPVPAPPPQPVEAVFTPFFSPSTSIWSAGNGSLGVPGTGAASPQTPGVPGVDAVADSIRHTARLYGMCCPLTQVCAGWCHHVSHRCSRS